MNIKQQTRRELVYAWISMMILTVGTMIAGHVTSTRTLGFIWMSALMLITFLKAKYILRFYLNLKAASGSWNTAFNAFLLILLISILALFALPAMIAAQ